MRSPTIHATLASALVASTASFGTAPAQTTPTAQQIINQLKPSSMLNDITRGIRPLAQRGAIAPPTSESAVPMAAHPAEQTATAPSTNLDIDFQSGSAKLTPQAIASLDQLGQALTSPTLAEDHFKVVGHTDTVGNAMTNQVLSEQRAAAVKSYLETKFNIASIRLESQGVGASDLLVQTPPNTAEPRNRRVQVVNIGQ